MTDVAFFCSQCEGMLGQEYHFEYLPTEKLQKITADYRHKDCEHKK